MRPLVLTLHLSLDGFGCDDDTETLRFFEKIDDDEHEQYLLGMLRGAGTHIMGRVTYQGMARAWPASSHPIAEPMNEIPKVVFSRTLRSAEWGPARIAAGDTAQEIARLKQEPGGEIIAHGGSSFARSLTRLGLVDEYRLILAPIAAGSGSQLFSATDHAQPMKLVSSRAFPSGILALAYRLAGDAQAAASSP